jgi:hypothetical protein
VRLALILLLLLVASPALAQDKTDPFELPHPTTGEPGVWIPVWLQRIELSRKQELTMCQAQRTLMGETISEQKAHAASLKAANLEITAANAGLKDHSAALGLQLEEARGDNAVYERWAWGSTGAALVAISVLVLQAAL